MDNERIHEILREHGEALVRIEEQLRALPCAEHVACMRSMKDTLYGNGRVGLTTRLDRVERIVSALTWVVGVAVSAGIVASVGAAITALVR